MAEALLLDRETVRNHFKRYRKGGLAALCNHDAGGSNTLLTEAQLQALDQHLKDHFYLTAKEIAHYVKQTWNVSYSESGITQLLKRLGYVYKNPSSCPVKPMRTSSASSLKNTKRSRPQKPRKIRFISWVPRSAP